MRKLRLLIIVLSFFQLSFLVQASELKNETLDELLILSGFESQANDMLSSIKGLVANSVTSSRSSKSPINHLSVIDKLIKPDQLVDTLKEQLKLSLTEEEAKRLIDWYSSNLGNRIARAEEAAAQPEAMLEIQKYAAKLSSDIDRMSLSKELVYASGFYDKSFDTQAIMSLMAEVISQKARANDKAVNVDAIKQSIEQQQSMMKVQLENFLLITVAYTYRDFSASEIDEYLAVLVSPEMKKFNKLGQHASLQSLEEMVKSYASN